MDDIDMFEEFEKKDLKKPRWVWVVLIGGLLAALVAYQTLGLWPSAILLLIACTVCFRSKRLKGFRRIFYFAFVPFIVTTVVTILGLKWLLKSLAAEGLLEGTMLKFLTDDPGASASIIGLGVGILAPFILREIYLLFTMEQLISFTNLSPQDTRTILSGILFNIGQPYIMIKDGEVTKTRPADALTWFGPGLAVITPGHAVVFERGGDLTKIELAGVVWLDKFERVSKIIDLRPQTSVDMVENIITRDGVPLNIQLKIFYEIARTGPPSLDEPYPVDKETVFRAACAVRDWQLAVPFIAGDVLRDIIAKHDLDDLLQYGTDPDKPIFRQAIRDEVKERVDKITLGYFGTNVTWVDIGEIEMPEETRARLLHKWLLGQEEQVAWAEQRVKRIRSATDAEVIETVELARANAQRYMLEAISTFVRGGTIPPQAAVFMRFAEVLDKLAKDPSTKILFPYGTPFERADFEELDAVRQAFADQPGQALPPPPPPSGKAGGS